MVYWRSEERELMWIVGQKGVSVVGVSGSSYSIVYEVAVGV